MSYSLRPVGEKVTYPNHKYFRSKTKIRKKRQFKKMYKYEWFNEDLYLQYAITIYSNNFKYNPRKSWVMPRWRKVYRIRRKYLNRKELRDIYNISKDNYIKKYGEERYI